MNWDTLDWKLLEEIRQHFLEEKPGASGDYWASRRHLEHYDFTFARRIAWKWQCVLKDILPRSPLAAFSTLIDWGCGSGVASREVIAHLPSGTVKKVFVWDRSALARDFAAEKIRELDPSIDVKAVAHKSELPLAGGTLLMSHVMNEIDSSASAELWTRLGHNDGVIIVEPALFHVSRRLTDWRKEIMRHHVIVGPCTHAGKCGMEQKGNEKNWCHHFAEAPSEVHQDAGWRKLSSTLRIDLRATPFTYLAGFRGVPALPPGASRIIGKSRVYKGFLKFLNCSAEGVVEERYQQRSGKALFKRLEKDSFFPPFWWERNDKGEGVNASETEDANSAKPAP